MYDFIKHFHWRFSRITLRCWNISITEVLTTAYGRQRWRNRSNVSYMLDFKMADVSRKWFPIRLNFTLTPLHGIRKIFYQFSESSSSERYNYHVQLKHQAAINSYFNSCKWRAWLGSSKTWTGWWDYSLPAPSFKIQVWCILDFDCKLLVVYSKFCSISQTSTVGPHNKPLATGQSFISSRIRSGTKQLMDWLY